MKSTLGPLPDIRMLHFPTVPDRLISTYSLFEDLFSIFRVNPVLFYVFRLIFQSTVFWCLFLISNCKLIAGSIAVVSLSSLTWLMAQVLAWYSSLSPDFIISLSVYQLWCELKMELGLSGWLSPDAISNDEVVIWYPKEISGLHHSCTKGGQLFKLSEWKWLAWSVCKFVFRIQDHTPFCLFVFWLKTTEICFLSLLEARILKSRCWQVGSFWRL